MSGELTVTDMKEMAQAALKSGYFATIANDSQALIKLQYAQDLGIPATAAMSGIYIVDGKPMIASALLAGLIKKSGRYDYRVVEKNANRCQIDFYVGEKKIGSEVYTAEMAERAGLSQRNPWRKYPEQMLFARCISAGSKTHCPDTVLGGVYIRDEYDDGSVDAEIEINPDDKPQQQPSPEEQPEVVEAEPVAEPSMLDKARLAFSALSELPQRIILERMRQNGMRLEEMASNESWQHWVYDECTEKIPAKLDASVFDVPQEQGLFIESAIMRADVGAAALALRDVVLVPSANGKIPKSACDFMLQKLASA